MRILYDNQIFKVQRFGGVSRYCAELMLGMNKQQGFTSFPKKFFSRNEHLRQLGLAKYSFVNSINIPGKKFVENYIRRKEERFLYTNIKNGDFDIYHPTYYNPSYLKYMPKGKVAVATIHDMTFELYYDKQYSRIHDESIHKKNIIEMAKHIITPSQTTKNDILKIYPQVGEENITVIYHGSSLPEHMPESNIDVPARYLLYVGKRGKYKNFNWLVEALAGYLRAIDIHLVCAGGRPFSKDESSLIEELGLRGKIIYTDINSDEDLATMYKKAACFIYPSSHEGFGIPILEAYSCGCPSLLAESSCFPEIGGNGALYFQNGNKEQLITQLEKLLNDKELVESVRQNGKKRLKDFSWQKTVNDHVDVYRKVSG